MLDISVSVKPVNDPPFISVPEFIILRFGEDKSLIFNKKRDKFNFFVGDPDLRYFPGTGIDFESSISFIFVYSSDSGLFLRRGWQFRGRVFVGSERRILDDSFALRAHQHNRTEATKRISVATAPIVRHHLEAFLGESCRDQVSRNDSGLQQCAAWIVLSGMRKLMYQETDWNVVKSGTNKMMFLAGRRPWCCANVDGKRFRKLWMLPRLYGEFLIASVHGSDCESN